MADRAREISGSEAGAGEGGEMEQEDPTARGPAGRPLLQDIQRGGETEEMERSNVCKTLPSLSYSVELP